MAPSRWFRLVGMSFGAAAAAATAQFGVVHGLGIIDWSPGQTRPDQTDNAWPGLLPWVVFLFGAAVLAGAAAARRAIRAIRGRRGTVAARVLAALSAALGAAVAFPLFWLPARAVPPALAPDAELAVAVAAGVGVALGVVLAVGALTAAPIAVNLAATVSWIWLFALVSAAMVYAHDRTPATPRLGMIDAPQVVSRADLWFGPFLMVGIAGAFGLAVAAAGRWLQASRLGIALSGFAGPSLVAAAYLVAGPGVAGGTRMEPYIASLLAVTVGLLVSTAVSGRSSPGTTASTPAVTRAIAGRPARLAIEAAPMRTYEQRERPERRAARRVHAIAAAPYVAAEDVAAEDVKPQPAERFLVSPGSEEDRNLRKSERDHISWMEKLVNTPADPDLNSRERS